LFPKLTVCLRKKNEGQVSPPFASHVDHSKILRVLVAIAISAPAATIASVAASASRGARAAETLPRRTFLARTRFIDRERTALKIFLVKHGNRLLSVSRRSHLNKRKAAGTACRSVLHDAHRNYSASLGKEVLQIIFGRGVSEVSHKQLCCHTVMGLVPNSPRLVTVPDLGFNHHR
jgi:hypothetical protein